MIAATGATPAPQAQPAPGSGASATQPAEAGRPRDGAQAPRANEKHREAAAARDARAADAATRDGEAPASEADAPAFAELLAANAGGQPGATAAREAAEDTDLPAAATTDLPDRLLSLLAGSWGVVAEPAPTGAATDPLAGAGVAPGRGAPAALPGLAATPAATTPPAAEGDAAIATAANDGAASGDAGAAALAALAGDAATADAAANAPSVDALQAAAPPPGAGPVANNARPVAAVPGTPLPMPANPEAGFDDGFGARIAWMAEQRLGHAEIRLNPEHIGPIDVRVQLDGTRVSAEFHSAHADVRQAIEASVPRLREMLGQQGLQLGHADVGQRHAQGQPARGDHAGANGSAGDAGRDADAVARAPAATLRSRGLLDEYA